MKECWEKVKLKEICSKGSSNISLNKIEDNNGSYALFGAAGFVKGIDFYHQSSPYIGIVKDGSGVGRVNIYPENSSLVGTMQYIYPNDNCLLGFLKYLLEGLHLEKFKTGAAIPHIYFKDYGNCVVPIPPLSDQQRIVEELDLLSSIIEKKKEQLKELDNLAQSIFYDMFGDIENNSKSFSLHILGEVCNLKAGKAIKADELHEKDETLYPCYGGNGIRGYIDRYSHSGNFPIIGRQGALCGNVNFASGDFYATEHAVVVTPLIEINKTWLFYLLMAMNLGQYAHGVAQPGLSVKDLLPLSIPLPPLSLQQQFASKIEAIEKQKELIKQSIKEVETLFNSRMDYYFS